MNKHTDCSICSEAYDTLNRLPRGCSKCGNNVCDVCLNDINAKSKQFICPFCKNVSPTIWAKNLPFIHMLEESQGGALVCAPHKRKIMAFCCSSDCKLPAGICDKAECSRQHKEYGTNNLPMSLISDQQEDEQALGIDQCISFMHRQIEKTLLKWIEQKKSKPSQSMSSMIRKSKDNPESIAKMTSSQLAVFKSKIMSQENELKEDRDKVLKKAQSAVVQELIEVLSSLRINYDDIMVKEPELPVSLSPPKSSSSVPAVVASKKDDHNYLFELVEQIVGGKFRNELIFDSTAHPASSFKSRIGGHANLLSRVELIDGTIFGSYFKVAFPARITGDRMYTDSDAFVYWQNERTFFEAAPGTKSQFDVSTNFLFSVGNTYHWDGFWFEKDFATVNHGRSNLTISSDQYTGLFINYTSNAVRSVKMFRLIF